MSPLFREDTTAICTEEKEKKNRKQTNASHLCLKKKKKKIGKICTNISTLYRRPHKHTPAHHQRKKKKIRRERKERKWYTDVSDLYVKGKKKATIKKRKIIFLTHAPTRDTKEKRIKNRR